MKTSIRRTLALAAGSLALAAGLAVPTASPASAASCTDVLAIRGAAPVATVNLMNGARTLNVSSTLTVGSTWCAADYVYSLQVIDSNNRQVLSVGEATTRVASSDEIALNSGTTSSIASSESALTFLVGVRPARGISSTTYESWLVSVPNSGYDSATNTNTIQFGQSCPAHIRGSYC